VFLAQIPAHGLRSSSKQSPAPSFRSRLTARRRDKPSGQKWLSTRLQHIPLLHFAEPVIARRSKFYCCGTSFNVTRIALLPASKFSRARCVPPVKAVHSKILCVHSILELKRLKAKRRQVCRLFWCRLCSAQSFFGLTLIGSKGLGSNCTKHFNANLLSCPMHRTK
jgi:hypothetical protein